MTEKQKELINKLYEVYMALSDECEMDEEFHKVINNNNDLIPMSLDDLAYEWKAVVEGKRR